MKPLLAILGELALIRHKLVLTQGEYYFRIEDLMAKARRDGVSGSKRDRESLATPIYWWAEDSAGKVYIASGEKDDPKVAFAEVGSLMEAL